MGPIDAVSGDGLWVRSGPQLFELASGRSLRIDTDLPVVPSRDRFVAGPDDAGLLHRVVLGESAQPGWLGTSAALERALGDALVAHLRRDLSEQVDGILIGVGSLDQPHQAGAESSQIQVRKHVIGAFQ